MDVRKSPMKSAALPRADKSGGRRDRADVCLREAVDAYCAERKGKLDKEARELLARLVDSSDAAKAFGRLKLKDRRAEACILTACIEADNIARTFLRRIEKQKDLLVRAKRWDEAVAILRNEVADRKEPLNLDIWSLSIFEPPADNAALEHALDLIASSIKWQRGIAEANLAYLGATRNTGIKQAAENAAIWIVAAGVYDAARKPPMPGKPHLRQVADLAEVILGTAISVDRVREARRKRSQLYLEMIGDQTERHFGKKRGLVPAAVSTDARVAAPARDSAFDRATARLSERYPGIDNIKAGDPVRSAGKKSG